MLYSSLLSLQYFFFPCILIKTKQLPSLFSVYRHCFQENVVQLPNVLFVISVGKCVLRQSQPRSRDVASHALSLNDFREKVQIRGDVPHTQHTGKGFKIYENNRDSSLESDLKGSLQGIKAGKGSSLGESRRENTQLPPPSSPSSGHLGEETGCNATDSGVTGRCSELYLRSEPQPWRR